LLFKANIPGDSDKNIVAPAAHESLPEKPIPQIQPTPVIFRVTRARTVKYDAVGEADEGAQGVPPLQVPEAAA
jgi:hypothetical protein